MGERNADGLTVRVSLEGREVTLCTGEPLCSLSHHLRAQPSGIFLAEVFSFEAGLWMLLFVHSLCL